MVFKNHNLVFSQADVRHKQKKKMKLYQFLLIFFLISINSCKYERADSKSISYAKMDLLSKIYKVYEKDEKYYVIRCKFNEKEKRERLTELKKKQIIEGNFFGFGGMNIFEVKSLNKDSIIFKFKSPPYNSNSIPSIKQKTGEFAIQCLKESDIRNETLIDGMEINKETAKVHIAEGKVYRLIELGSDNSEYSGLSTHKNDCRKKAEEKFGYQDYTLNGCLLTEQDLQKMYEYNNTVFNHLVETKEFEYENFWLLTRAFKKEFINCTYNKK